MSETDADFIMRHTGRELMFLAWCRAGRPMPFWEWEVKHKPHDLLPPEYRAADAPQDPEK